MRSDLMLNIWALFLPVLLFCMGGGFLIYFSLKKKLKAKATPSHGYKELVHGHVEKSLSEVIDLMVLDVKIYLKGKSKPLVLRISQVREERSQTFYLEAALQRDMMSLILTHKEEYEYLPKYSDGKTETVIMEVILDKNYHDALHSLTKLSPSSSVKLIDDDGTIHVVSGTEIERVEISEEILDTFQLDTYRVVWPDVPTDLLYKGHIYQVAAYRGLGE
jgi:hypothetical protein